MAGLATLAASVGLVLLPGATTPASAATSTSGVRCSGGVCTQTFYSDGSWSQPTASGDVIVTLAGGSGGDGGDGADGGKGRQIRLTTEEHSLRFTVGGAGVDADGLIGGAGGTNGGGPGGSATDGTGGGGGGGATTVFFHENQRKAVAAGGGGGGGGYESDGDQPKNFTAGGAAGLDGTGRDGGYAPFRTTRKELCPAAHGDGGIGRSEALGRGGAGGQAGLSDETTFTGPTGGGGGGGGGFFGPGSGGCSSEEAGGSGLAGSAGQGGAGGSYAGSPCVKLECLVIQTRNGGGGGGGGVHGGGGGGTGSGLAAGGGGGGASGTSRSERWVDLGDHEGAGFVTVFWRYATPRLTVVGSTTPTSDGPGSTVPIILDVTGRQSGSGSAGKVFIADQYGDASTVTACAPGATYAGRNVPNGTAALYCAVKPTVDTTYAVTYEPSGQYVADGGGADRQLARVTVAVGMETTTTTITSPGTVEVGTPITLRGTVSSRSQRPTGTATFDYRTADSREWTLLGSVDPVVRADGRTADASLETSLLPSSAQQVRMTYAGSATTKSSSGIADVNVLGSLLSLELSSSQLEYGDRLTLTAVAPACTTQDAARVRFRAVNGTGGTVADYGSYPVGSDHRARVTLTPSVGGLLLVADGLSSCNQSSRGSTTPWQVAEVNAARTAVEVDAPDSVLRGDSPSVTVRVSMVNRSATPSGTVSLTYPTASGKGRVSGALSGGAFTTNLRDLAAGASTIYAYYDGGNSFERSFTTRDVQVTLPRTTVTVSGTPQTASYGGVAPVTATVTEYGDPVTTGSVQVSTDRGVVQGELDATGHATLEVPVVGEAGATQQGSVRYLGTEQHAASEASYSWTVAAAPATISATQVGASYVDGSVQLAVTVSTETTSGQPAVPPAGGVSVRLQGSLFPRTVTMSECTSCSLRRGTITLPAGSSPAARDYVFSYFDSSRRTTADSVSVPVSVLAKREVTLGGVGRLQATAGDPVEVATSVRGADGPVTTGTVTLYDGTDALASGTAGSPLSFTPTWVGTRTLSLAYSGDGSHQPASRSDYATVVVMKATTDLRLTASRRSGEAIARSGESVAAGEPVTFTVSLREVAPGGPLSGTVQVHRSDRDAAVDVDVKDGSGSVTFDDLTPGVTVTVDATYDGTARHAAAGAVATVLTVIPAPVTTPVTVTKVSPHRLARGTTTTVAITGTGFTDTTSPRLDDATGVTLGPVTHVSSTTMTVPVTVTGAASAGSRTWSVTDGGRTATCRAPSACGLVVYLVPKLTGITGGSVRAGATTTVELAGSDLEAGMTARMSGAGVTVGPVQRTDDGHATVTLSVVQGQKQSSRTLTLLNPSGGRLVVKKAITVVR